MSLRVHVTTCTTGIHVVNLHVLYVHVCVLHVHVYVLYVHVHVLYVHVHVHVLYVHVHVSMYHVLHVHVHISMYISYMYIYVHVCVLHVHVSCTTCTYSYKMENGTLTRKLISQSLILIQKVTFLNLDKLAKI